MAHSFTAKRAALAAGACIALSAPAHAQQVIENGSVFSAANGAVHAHGGGILKVGRYYYWMGENRKPDGRFNAVSMYRSTDLKRWEFVNDILTAESAEELRISNIERPKVLYNDATKQYVLWAHYENGSDYTQARVIVATSSTVDGDYVYQRSFRPLKYSSRDMTLFKDDDGSAYLISASNNNYDLMFYRLNVSYTDTVEVVLNMAGGHREAPAIFKRAGVYFLITSGATGWRPNQATYQTSLRLTGGWTAPVPFGNGNSYNSQPAYVVTVQGTDATSYLYMGDRWGPAQGLRVADSQYVWLPLAFPTPTSLAMEERSLVTVNTTTGHAALWAPRARLHSLQSKANGLCATVAENALAYAREVQQQTCTTALYARVERRASGRDVQFVFQHSGLCLAQADAAAGGGAVVQHGCTLPRAQWKVSGARIVNRQSGLCLTAPDGAGGSLRVSACDGRIGQKWRIG